MRRQAEEDALAMFNRAAADVDAQERSEREALLGGFAMARAEGKWISALFAAVRAYLAERRRSKAIARIGALAGSHEVAAGSEAEVDRERTSSERGFE